VEEAKKKPTKAERLADLYKKANALNEELPLDIMNKLSLYGQILELIGGLHADSVKAYRLAEAKRRETIASAIVYGAELEGAEVKTAKDREAVAEVIGATARKEEALAEAEAQRWKNAYQSNIEMIQILKKKYDHLKEVSKGGI
jgi:hypothetical protein